VTGGVAAPTIPIFLSGRFGQSNAFRIETRRTPRRLGVTTKRARPFRAVDRTADTPVR
jgi:hypothetical protein